MPIVYCKSYLFGNFGVAISEIATPKFPILNCCTTLIFLTINLLYWCLTRESLDLVRRLDLGLLEQFTSNAVCHVALKHLRKVLYSCLYITRYYFQSHLIMRFEPTSDDICLWIVYITCYGQWSGTTIIINRGIYPIAPRYCIVHLSCSCHNCRTANRF